MRRASHAGKTKTKFIKRDATGGSFLNTLVNKLPFEMRLPGHNFTGPGTKLYKPVTRNFQKRRVNVNSIDEIWAADIIDMQAFSTDNS